MSHASAMHEVWCTGGRLKLVTRAALWGRRDQCSFRSYSALRNIASFDRYNYFHQVSVYANRRPLPLSSLVAPLLTKVSWSLTHSISPLQNSNIGPPGATSHHALTSLTRDCRPKIRRVLRRRPHTSLLTNPLSRQHTAKEPSDLYHHSLGLHGAAAQGAP